MIKDKRLTLLEFVVVKQREKWFIDFKLRGKQNETIKWLGRLPMKLNK